MNAEKKWYNALMEDVYSGEQDITSLIISEICDYAIENKIEPNKALAQVATAILDILEIATFNEWKSKEV